MSGDPTPEGITLLTRIAGVEGRGRVLLEIARDSGFRKVVSRAELVTNSSIGHAVKAKVTNLKPHTRYWYRFAGRTAESGVGRFRTAPPPGSRQPVRFGIFAGQEFTAGFFNAQAHLAREDLDFVLNLGNYICADEVFDDAVSARELRSPAPATTLDALRRRYREYRSDPDLRRMHAAHPIVSCWDDREVASGYAGAAGRESEYAGVARAVAYRSWFEAMPHYPKSRGSARIHHRPRFGRTLDVFVLDTRQFRQEPQCDNSGDPACLTPGARGDLLGRAQSNWLRKGLAASNATWKLVASPSPVSEFRSAPDRFYDFDGWQGYPAERDALLKTVGSGKARNTVFASAQLRRFVAGDVTDATGRVVAAEFTCGSVSERTDAETAAAAGRDGFGTIAAPAEPPEETERLRAANPLFVENDQLRHGYAVATVGREAFRLVFRKLATVQDRPSALVEGTAYDVRSGRAGLAS